MIKPIVYCGDERLRMPSIEVSKVSKKVKSLIKDMIETMIDNRGIGLAAQQVGRLERVFVINIPSEYEESVFGSRLCPDIEMPLVCINPVITYLSEQKWTMVEGCLSFPGYSLSVERSWEVELEYMDENQESCTIRVCGILARAIQHEYDHLNGVLFIDRV